MYTSCVDVLTSRACKYTLRVDVQTYIACGRTNVHRVWTYKCTSRVDVQTYIVQNNKIHMATNMHTHGRIIVHALHTCVNKLTCAWTNIQTYMCERTYMHGQNCTRA